MSTRRRLRLDLAARNALSAERLIVTRRKIVGRVGDHAHCGGTAMVASQMGGLRAITVCTP